VDRGFRGWAHQVREGRAHSKRVTKERCDHEGGSKSQFDARWADRNKMWALQMRIAKRADKYIKAELARLDELWENR